MDLDVFEKLECMKKEMDTLDEFRIAMMAVYGSVSKQKEICPAPSLWGLFTLSTIVFGIRMGYTNGLALIEEITDICEIIGIDAEPIINEIKEAVADRDQDQRIAAKKETA